MEESRSQETASAARPPFNRQITHDLHVVDVGIHLSIVKPPGNDGRGPRTQGLTRKFVLRASS